MSIHCPEDANIKVVSAGWALYDNLSALGYSHAKVLHKDEFVNSEGDHTNSVVTVEELDSRYARYVVQPSSWLHC